METAPFTRTWEPSSPKYLTKTLEPRLNPDSMIRGDWIMIIPTANNGANGYKECIYSMTCLVSPVAAAQYPIGVLRY